MSTQTARDIAIGRVEDVPLWEGRNVELDGRRIAVFRTDAGYAATAAECPHGGGPLADGLVGVRTVTCPLHGLRFNLETGECISSGAGACPAVAVHEVCERSGWLYVGLRE